MNNSEKQWKIFYKVGAVTTIIFLCGIILDMVVGSVTGGNVAALPRTAIERFNEFNDNWCLGLYHLDLLTVLNQLIFIPSIFALYAVHRKTNNPSALLALILFLVGTTIFVTDNTALTMLDLSKKYSGATSDEQRLLFAAAGEAMLAKGSLGSLGVTISFALIPLAKALMSVVMLYEKVFNRLTSYFGLVSNSLMVVYIILMIFIPSVEKYAFAFAIPAGLLVIAWMILFTVKLFKLSKIEDN